MSIHDNNIYIRKYLKMAKLCIKSTKNWPQAFLFRLGFLNKIDINLRNIGRVKLTKTENNLLSSLIIASLEELTNKQKKTIHTIISQKNDPIININGIKIMNYELCLIIENFVLDQFDMEKGNGENIIDIGANRADTALYFANKGYNVIGFEPVKDLFEKGIKNINLNKNLKNQIILVNKAIGCKNGKTKIFFNNDLDNSSGDASSYLKEKENFEIVETITIEKILKDYNIKPYILKIDCEGCEVDIILNSDLSMFKEIYFEYHTPFTNVQPETMIKKLENQNFELITKNKMILDSGFGIIKMINKGIWLIWYSTLKLKFH